MILIKNAQVYSPAPLGQKDVLVSFDRILQIADHIDTPYTDTLVLDGTNKYLVPGFIDQHVHICGGGGEGGFHTRTPEIQLSQIVRAGVTTLVGLLGTDGYTKTPRMLLAKTKELNNEGITAFCLTGSYAYPSDTVIGTVYDDIVYISEIIGCKLAISDHRCSHPSKEEIIRLVSDIRMASLIAGKVGELHLHVGAGKECISQIIDIVRTTDIPISHFRPTHLGRHLEAAIEFTRLGGYADITAKENVPNFFPDLIKETNADLLTISSDSNGSMPKWDKNHERIVGMGVGDIGNLYRVVREMVMNKCMPLEKALTFITSNVATALSLYPRKGSVQIGSDADIVLLDEDYLIDSVIAKGRLMMSEKTILVEGTFEA